MKDFGFIDPGFDVKHSSTYYLSIQLALDGFSFSVLDVLSNTFILFKHKSIPTDEGGLAADYYCQYVYDFLISEKAFKFPYKGIGIIYISPYSTMVPLAIFDKAKAEKLFEANHGKMSNIDILSNKLKNLDMVNVFAIPDCLLRILSRQFINFKLYHQATPLIINAITDNSNYKRGLRIYINQNKKIVDMLVVNSGRLMLFNSFGYNSESDILYYLVNIAEQLQNIGPVEEVVLSGKIQLNEILQAQIGKYFKPVSLFNPSEKFKFSDSFEEFTGSGFSLLFNMHSCE
ncbi:MAG: DUF3822 family protein [Bacteroidales bacterium]|nr:DUF3822 family protein [Bacteroidales bacterium]MCF8456259.1 DUF3822 family protein [Bacteroidales bacterium]